MPNLRIFYCTAAQPVDELGIPAIANIKIASMKEKVQCIFWFHETKSPLTVQRNFRREYGQYPRDVKSITGWPAKFKETGNVGRGDC